MRKPRLTDRILRGLVTLDHYAEEQRSVVNEEPENWPYSTAQRKEAEDAAIWIYEMQAYRRSRKSTRVSS